MQGSFAIDTALAPCNEISCPDDCCPGILTAGLLVLSVYVHPQPQSFQQLEIMSSLARTGAVKHSSVNRATGFIKIIP